MKKSSIRIAVLGSGEGSTATALFSQPQAESVNFSVVCAISTRSTAGILRKARDARLPTHVVPYHDASSFADELESKLRLEAVDLLVLCGFLKLLPESVIAYMDGRVINSHPSLLPKFGGKGMYGRRVHEAVAESGDTETGVTFHWVSSEYDSGSTVHQVRIPVGVGESAVDIENRAKQAELDSWPTAIRMAIAEINSKMISTISNEK